MKVPRIIERTAEVTEGCFQCPYEERDKDMNATIYYCAHSDAPDGNYGYAKCIPFPSEGFPDWCPLGLEKENNKSSEGRCRHGKH